MSFRDEILFNIRTPQEVKDSEDSYAIKQCKESAEATFEEIKRLFKSAAYNGNYENCTNGNSVIEINPCIIGTSNDISRFDDHIENRLLFDSIGISYETKRKYSLLGEIEKTIFTYNVFIKDEFNYQNFMKELRQLATPEGISISPKMNFTKYSGNIPHYKAFPGILIGEIDGVEKTFHHPKEWVRFYLFCKMKL